ncbi:hypothetical protein C0992_003553, partial [Termitomyces sp. T32_za158]
MQATIQNTDDIDDTLPGFALSALPPDMEESVAKTTLVDPVETYFKSLAPEDKHAILTIAQDSQAIRSIMLTVDNKSEVEAIVNSGSQIISMSADIANELGIIYDSAIHLNMQSANGTVDRSPWTCKECGVQSYSKKEEGAKEGEMTAQHFQCVQCNKKLAKKENRAKNAVALAHRAQNNFSGHIPDGLGVKVWGPLNVERLNSCFRGALALCCYYSYFTNTRADANHAIAFKFSSGKSAKVPGTKVYQFACQGFPGTPYKLKQLYKYYANPHVPHRNRIVVYILLSKLKDFTQRCNVSLHDCTMTLLYLDPSYRNLINPMQGPEDLSFAEKHHILSCFLRIKDDGSTALR